MSKILLVGKYSSVEPLGMMFLAGSLKQNGHQAEIFLLESDKNSLVGKAYDGGYDFIGFSAYTGFHKTIFNKLDVLRRSFKTILGGPHVTYFHKECEGKADYVVIGEGFTAINNIVDEIADPGLVFTPYLIRHDYIPIPDRDALYLADKRFFNSKIKSVMTSFGCPYNCSYCYNDCFRKLYPEFKVRQRSVDVIIEECRQLKKYPLGLIYFQDDCFGFNLDWLSEFAAKYSKNVGIPFHCQIRPEQVNQDRLGLFKEAGCQGITMAIETINEKVRYEILNRRMSNDLIFRACEEIKFYGFKLRTEQMLGLPDTTFQDELDLLKFNSELNPDIAWASIFVPYLGTKLGDFCKKISLYEGDNDDLSDSFFSETRLNFTHERKKQTNILHKIFSTCAKIPNGSNLAEKFAQESNRNFDAWSNLMRQHLYDNCLYKT